MVEAWIEQGREYGALLGDEEPDTGDLFPLEQARVERGRILGALPGSWIEAEGWSWAWYPVDHPGRGVTTAVTWSADR